VALFRKVRGDFHKLPSSMGETVGQQDLSAVTQFRCVARQGITHLNGPGEFRYAVLQNITQVFAGVLAPAPALTSSCSKRSIQA
jgi:hypothetical protein